MKQTYCRMAAAQYKNGNDLYELLQADKRFESSKNSLDISQGMLGVGYVMGVVDSLDKIAFCISGGVVVKQMRDVTLQYLEIHPEKRHIRGHLVVIHALSEKFPCAKK